VGNEMLAIDAAARSPSRIRRDRRADRKNVLDEVHRAAEPELENRLLIAHHRAQDAMCATIERVGSIRDSKGRARVLGAFCEREFCRDKTVSCRHMR
jgi:hypothetical protein